MRKSALSQHVALVSVKRDRAKEELRINEGLGAMRSGSAGDSGIASGW